MTNGDLIHKLAARALITGNDVCCLFLLSDIESDCSTLKCEIGKELALRYNLASKYTSFVAIEKRDDGVEGSMIRVQVPQNTPASTSPTTPSVLHFSHKIYYIHDLEEHVSMPFLDFEPLFRCATPPNKESKQPTNLAEDIVSKQKANGSWDVNIVGSLLELDSDLLMITVPKQLLNSSKKYGLHVL
jgi:hypothetical protein